MKQIKPIALKKATILSNEEMKNLFGGSATTTTTSSCELSCPNGSSIVRTMTDCPDGCGVDKSGLWCSNNGIKATYTCESGTSNS
ncbi:MAG: TIGR04149 family rSAM-modified RiPP [Bacteroidaceae bacterium]